MVNLGDIFPNFEAEATTVKGKLKFHDWIGDGWAVLFSHPADYTPVCTTELGMVMNKLKDFEKRGVKVIALSCDGLEDHLGWGKDVMHYAQCDGSVLPYPIISDPKRELAVQLGMVDPEEKDKAGLPLTCRAVFIIGPDKRLKLSMLYPATTGRNFDEILRVIDSLQLTANKKVATPANWQKGGDCMVIPSVKGDELKKLFPEVKIKDVPSGKPYIRVVAEPK